MYTDLKPHPLTYEIESPEMSSETFIFTVVSSAVGSSAVTQAPIC